MADMDVDGPLVGRRLALVQQRGELVARHGSSTGPHERLENGRLAFRQRNDRVATTDFARVDVKPQVAGFDDATGVGDGAGVSRSPQHRADARQQFSGRRKA